MSHFNRFDIAEAYYLYALHHAKGMYQATDRWLDLMPSTSETRERTIYQQLADIRFKPSPMLGNSQYDFHGLSENGYEIYQGLLERYPLKPLTLGDPIGSGYVAGDSKNRPDW